MDTPPPPNPYHHSQLTMESATLQSHAVRIPPNANLVDALVDAAQQAMSRSNAKSAFVITAVGSLSTVTLRMAATDDATSTSTRTSTETSTSAGDSIGASKKSKTASNNNAPLTLAQTTTLQVRTFPNHFEIVSLVGTFSMDGGKHLHMSVANAEGKVLGGHLVDGTVFTTLELVLGTMPGVSFARETDVVSGYRELVVRPS
jgi:predicted DNA-binding protein with PD1-like motif